MVRAMNDPFEALTTLNVGGKIFGITVWKHFKIKGSAAWTPCRSRSVSSSSRFYARVTAAR